MRTEHWWQNMNSRTSTVRPFCNEKPIASSNNARHVWTSQLLFVVLDVLPCLISPSLSLWSNARCKHRKCAIRSRELERHDSHLPNRKCFKTSKSMYKPLLTGPNNFCGMIIERNDKFSRCFSYSLRLQPFLWAFRNLDEAKLGLCPIF